MIESGYLVASDKYYEIEEADDLSEVDIESTSINRDKIATSIAMFQDTATIVAPDINKSGFGFTLNEETNTIQTGLKVVAMLGNRYIYEILRARPYYSFREFLDSTNIPRNRVVNLIKANAFREITDKNPLELLEEYVWLISKPKKVLNGRNINMLITMNLLPDKYDFERKVFNWWKYLTPMRRIRKGYVKLDDPAARFYEQHFDLSKIEHFDDGEYISESYGKSLVDSTNERIKQYIKENHDSLLEKVNQTLFDELWEKYQSPTIEDAEMDSLRMYTGKHPLSKYNLSYDKVTEMEEDHFVGEFNIRGKKFPKYHIYRVVGTVIAKEKIKNMVTILTPEGAIKIKMWQDIFNIYDRKVTTVVDGVQQVVQGSFFEVGTHIAVFGKYQGGMIYPKVYRDTGSKEVIYKINIEDGGLKLEEKMSE